MSLATHSYGGISMATVLITGSSSGIGLATALELGRAGHKVFATMRNPAHAPELGEIAKRERLPVSIRTLDVDSDDSVRTCFAGIREPLDALVNNAGVERHGAIEELPMEAFTATNEHQLLRSRTLHQGGSAGDARGAKRLHRQHQFRGGQDVQFAPRPLFRLEVRPGSDQRSPRGRGEAVQHPGRHRGTRRPGHENGPRAGRPGAVGLSSGAPVHGPVPRRPWRTRRLRRRRPQSSAASSKAARGNCAIPRVRTQRVSWAGGPPCPTSSGSTGTRRKTKPGMPRWSASSA